MPPVEPYEPSQFFRRELPSLLAVLCRVATPLETVVIDGYVWLHDEDKPGLGAHLYEALGKRTPIIGVAKTPFAGARQAGAVVRGTSQRPLFMTAANLELGTACRSIQRMHGAFRLPTLLKRLDQLSRQRAGPVEPHIGRAGDAEE
ncbi:MAG: endonuclease V [Isosphaeraceae bacterium]|nr:endonuclease V [Isosphaeraceae bacterium]